jgi:cytochrome P450
MMTCPYHPQPVLAEFNPFEPSQCHDPYPMYAHAREHAPIFFSPVLNMWVVTRHEDICEIARDPLRFSSHGAVDTVSQMPPEVHAILAQGLPPSHFLVNYDPPAHTRVRRLCNKGFTPKRVMAMEPRIRELTNALVDNFVQAGTADLMAQFAYPLPRLVIADVVGVPRADIDKFGQWADEYTMMLFATGLPVEQQLVGARSSIALQNYAIAMIEERRKQPQDDLLSDLVHAQLEDGTSLDTNELVGLVNSFLIAGHVTTSDLLGNMIFWLLKQPEQWQALCCKPQLAPQLIEETLRRDAAVPGLMRVATEDMRFKGVSIAKGSRLFLAFASANHDEAIFPDPTHFDIERKNMHKHLAFGQGIHFCVGAPLARLEARITLEVLSQRLPNLCFQPGQTVTYRPNLVLRGPDHLHLTWDKSLMDAVVNEGAGFIPVGSVTF